MFFEKCRWKDTERYDKIDKMGGVCPDNDLCFMRPEYFVEHEICTGKISDIEFRWSRIEGEKNYDQ